MSTASVSMPGGEVQWKLPSRGTVGMYSMIAAETAIFTIFVVAYIFYIGKSISGPQPKDVLHAPIFYTVCLLSSSITIHIALKQLEKANMGAFALWWFLTFALGAIFIVGTGIEWNHLINDEGLTVRTNLFGTTYYSLVGLHAFHVTVGLLLLLTVLIFSLTRKLTEHHTPRVEVLSLYWHFVDVVWVVVFTVVYIIGR